MYAFVYLDINIVTSVFIFHVFRIVNEVSTSSLPRIHVYSFSTSEDVYTDVVNRVAAALMCSPDAITEKYCHIVRDISPKKLMVCLTFRLPMSVSLAEPLLFD